VIAAKAPHNELVSLAMNIRRLMAKADVTQEAFSQSTGIDERTLRGILKMRNQPHARTIKKIADALGVDVDELYRPVALASRQFDRDTNTFVDAVVRRRPELFRNWSEGDYDELYSRFGVGGQLTEEGVTEIAERMVRHRAIRRKVQVIQESDGDTLLTAVVNELYEMVTRGKRLTCEQLYPDVVS
jgi:transcriptional regulator with XRE-family HTH domain